MISKEYSYEKDVQVKQEEARQAGIEEGRAEAKMKVGKEIAIRLAEMGMSIEDIAKAVKTDISIVKKWLIEG